MEGWGDEQNDDHKRDYPTTYQRQAEASEKIIPMKRYKLMPSARNQKNRIKSTNQRAKAGEFCS